MDVLFILIPLAVVLVFLIGCSFYWCVMSGQFDDLERPAHEIVADDDAPCNTQRPCKRSCLLD